MKICTAISADGKAARRRSVLRFLPGCCALLLYANAYSPLGLGLAALAGSLDPSHHAVACAGTEGAQLVLRHSAFGLPHHHGVVARALTLFARPTNGADSDHVIQFSTSDVLNQRAQLAAPPPDLLEQSAPALVGTFLPLGNTDSLWALPHSPPPQGGLLFSVRSTVLLI